MNEKLCPGTDYISAIEEVSGELSDKLQYIWIFTEQHFLIGSDIDVGISLHYSAVIEGMQYCAAMLGYNEEAEELFFLRLLLQERNHLLAISQSSSFVSKQS